MSHFVAGLVAIALATTATAAEPGMGAQAAVSGDVAAAKAFVERYVAAWDRKDSAAIGAMTAPDADGVFVTAESPRIWVGFPTMMPAIDGVLRGLDSRRSTVQDLRVKLLPGGKAAVATFLLDTEGKYEGKPFVTPGMRITYVLEDRKDRWLLVSAHGSLPAADADGRAVTTGPDVEAITALIEQARKADLAADRSFYERTLTDDFSFGVSTGEWESKQSKLAYLGSDRHAVTSEAISDLRVRVHGTAAIATFTVTIVGSWEKKPFHVTAIITQTWVKEASGWKLAATHGSRREERGGSATDSAQAGAAPVSGAIPMAGWAATYVTEGQGLPCIVLSLRNYHPRTFSPRFKGALRCTFLDARFSVPEATADPKDPYTIAAAVEDLEAARRALGMKRFVLVGHSIQGSIAIAYALRYPKHVSHVIAIGAVPGISRALGALAKDNWERNASLERKVSYDKAQKAFMAAAPGLQPAEQAPAMIRADAAKRWYDPEYDERPLMDGAPFNMPVVSQLFGQPFELFAGGVRVEPPTFLALGRHDYVVPPTAWDGQSTHFRDLTLVLFERAGHTPQIEAAAEFDDLVLAWLSRH